MKSEILKIAKVKSEKEFYKKYPSEEAFMKAHGKAFKKAAMGTAMVKKQLTQLTDFSNPPMAQAGAQVGFSDYMTGAQAKLAGMSPEAYKEQQAQAAAQQAAAASNKGGGGLESLLGGMDMEALASMIGRNGFNVPQAQKQNFNKYLQGTNQPGLNPDGTIKQVGDAFNNASMAQYSGQQIAKDMSAQFATPSADKLMGVNDINKGASAASGFDAAGAGKAALSALPSLIGGVETILGRKEKLKELQKGVKLSDVVARAAESRDINKAKQNYVRDVIVQPDQLYPSYGTKTNYLAQDGAEIQNTYNPGNLYNDLGYEPLNDSNVKQYKYGGKAQFGIEMLGGPAGNLGSLLGGEITGNKGRYASSTGVGSTVGSIAGNLLLPGVGGVVGSALGGLAEELISAKQLREMREAEENLQGNVERAAWQSAGQATQSQFSSSMEEGGWVSHDWQPQVITKFGEHKVSDLLKPPHDAEMLRAGGHLKEYTPPSAAAMSTERPMQYGGQMAMGGDLKVLGGGYAEPISYNPFLPEGGETVMFRGASHDNGGMPIKYGENGVEVEGGEPATVLKDGGSAGNNLVVFGNMKIDDMAANEIGIEEFKNKKYKHVMNDLSKFESRQNKIVEKGTELVNSASTNDPFDQLSINSGEAMVMGGNAKLLNAAIIKQRTALAQNSILDTAKQLGVKSDKLAEGKFVKETSSDMAKFGAKMETAQQGVLAPKDKTAKQTVAGIMQDIMNRIPGGEEYVNVPYEYGDTSAPLEEVSIASKRKSTAAAPVMDEVATKKKRKGLGKDILTGLSSLVPLVRPTNQMGLDPSQLSGEMLALATNQLEPVQAQTFQPMLDTPYDISLQDQINAVDAQANAAIRAAGQNPAAQAIIMAQASEAKNKIRGEQMRINQTQKANVYEKNRELLNQAKLQNLQILDNQYLRQAQAKSNTKAQAIEALKSVSAKVAQNKLENKQLATLENMYNFRFTPGGRAYNVNAPQFFNMEGSPFAKASNASGQLEEGYEDLFNAAGRRVGTRKSGKDNISSRNGSIVKALKNL